MGVSSRTIWIGTRPGPNGHRLAKTSAHILEKRAHQNSLANASGYSGRFKTKTSHGECRKTASVTEPSRNRLTPW